jgi:hypothetical protein
MIRADRTLAIRLSPYANVPAEMRVYSADDVLKVIRQGRIRYVVTCEPLMPDDDWTEENQLTQNAVDSRPELFTMIGEFPTRIDFMPGESRWRVWLWAYRQQLPDGPSELPVVVPTAKMVLPP